MFPRARVLRMDLDTTTRKGSHDRILRQFADREAEARAGFAALSGVLLILGERVLTPTQIFVMGMLVAVACGALVWRMRRAYGDALRAVAVLAVTALLVRTDPSALP